MTLEPLHEWTVSPEEAIRLQEILKERLCLRWDDRPVKTVGGVDTSVQETQARCAIVVLEYPSLMPIEGVVAATPLDFPYIPGLLAFREGPAILAAWKRLVHLPDVLLFDGHGIAHPRRMGIAAHMGLWLERPTIGVAKSRLYGRHGQVGPHRGDFCDLCDEQGQVIGVVLRTREGTNPIYVSPGHLIDTSHAREMVMTCVRGYRLPEPTRLAHHLAGGRKMLTTTDEQLRLF